MSPRFKRPPKPRLITRLESLSILIPIARRVDEKRKPRETLLLSDESEDQEPVQDDEPVQAHASLRLETRGAIPAGSLRVMPDD